VTTSLPDPASFAFEQLAPAARPVAAVADTAAVVAGAQADAEQIRVDAREAGFQAGMQEAAETLRPAAETLAQAVAALQDERATSAEQLERHAVDLALAIAEKAVQAAVEVEPDRVADVIKGAMRLMVEREDVVIHVNPVDVDVVTQALEGLGDRHIEVVEERRVARGGALLRTSVGEIDARLETKLERAGQVLRAELES
jgi:flagellar assembly protein FliH